MTRLMFKYRIHPSRKQISRLYTQFDLSCKVYNNLLELQRSTYKSTGKKLTKFDMNKIITKMKKIDTPLRMAQSGILENCSDRLSKAFESFFRRVKEKKAGKHIKVGYPRFKKIFHSITYPCAGFVESTENEHGFVRIPKVGRVPIIFHRPMQIAKTMTIKRHRSDKWFVIFSCVVEDNIQTQPSNKEIGIDVGLKSFATLSDGVMIENPRYLLKSEKKLKTLQRRLSRKKKGSKNRLKAKHLLAVQYEKVSNQRKDFLHKLSHKLVNEYGTIAMEDLNVNKMMQDHRFAKSIGDVGWGEFRRMMEYKASSAGTKLFFVDPYNTSQICSACGKVVLKKLSQRTHKCKHCGTILDRDVNSAINILHRVGQTRINACGHTTSTLGSMPSASCVVESGTTRGGR